jgi:predicted PurR-regulated permease PerM
LPSIAQANIGIFRKTRFSPGVFRASLPSLIVAIFAFATIFGLGAFMVSQVSQLANDLPRYESNLTDKIQSLQGVAAGTGPLERASDVLKDLKREIEKPGNVPPAEPSLGGQAQPSRPIPVEVRQPDPGALQLLAALIEPLIHPLTTTGIVVIFVIFILLQQNDLRNRLLCASLARKTCTARRRLLMMRARD